ncbi:predicted protein [Nematostella vectensis]|uniref:G-protein coupled receptors family 1 profile domain-containing protein n=2 Tax=Nematostella vectensis TaxID=45351 RepID=A7S856_NEMVE|nr:predicted protein [Nematostella vectensis]|eukprot:XP_001632169.1 predicted protein [Nematostella vectensis]
MESNEEGKIFKIVFYIFLFIFGTIGNLLVMVVIKSRKKRSVNDFFIFNLAISDLTFVLVSLPFYTYELFLRFDKFGFYCKVVWPMMSVTLCVSIFTLTFMSVERCRAIVFPLKPRIKRTSVLIGLSTVWVASLVCILPLSIVTSAEGELCMERWPSEGHRKAYTIALFAIQYAIPLLIIAMAYITIAIKLVRTEVPDRTSVNNRGQIVKRQSRKENFHIIRTVAVIVSLFLVCMLPNQIAWLLYDFEGEEQAKLFWSFAEALIFLHSCVNPVIYGSLTRQFREGYIR